MSPRPISASYLERKLRAICGVLGNNPLPDLADLNGLMVIENDRPEWSIAGNELLGARGFDTGAAVAAQFAFAIIENPDNSGVLSIVEQILITDSAPLVVNLEIGNPLSTPPGGMTNVPFLPRDLRLFRPIASPSPFATHLRDDGHAAVPMSGVPANSQLLTEVQLGGTGLAGSGPLRAAWILPPSSRLWLVAFSVNTQIQGDVVIRERPIEGAVEVR